MVLRIMMAAALLAALALGLIGATEGARSQTIESQGSVKQGTIRLKITAPEPGKWNVQRDSQQARTIYTCKALACPDVIRVTVSASRSLTSKPDPKALEKLAKVDLPKATRAASAAREVMSDGAETIETLVSETASFHGYPAVVNETKYARGQKAVYKGIAVIFAGSALIRVEAVSPDQALAQKSLADFIRGMEFQEGPPAPGKAGSKLI